MDCSLNQSTSGGKRDVFYQNLKEYYLLQAAAMLSTLLPRHTAKQTLPSSSPIQRPYPVQEYQEIVPVTNIMNNNTIEHEVLIENQVSNKEEENKLL